MASTAEFRSFLQNFVQGDTFAQADEKTQQAMLARVRDEFRPQADMPSEIDSVAEQVNVDFRRANNMGRYVPTGMTITGPWDEAGYEELSEEEKVAKIEDYRTRIPELAAQDTLNYQDTRYYLNRVFDEQKRIAQGENTGWVEDKGWRLFDGFAAGIASKVGSQDTADKIRSWSETNPKYDSDFTAQLAQGIGDIGASTAIFLGATAVSGGNVAVGSGALLLSGGVERYTTAYRDAIEKGMDSETASAAGIGSLPGAVVDAVGDRLIAGKFLPKNYDALLKTGSLEAKKKAITEIFADGQLRAAALRMARDFGAQGLSEAGGDWTAGYGAYIATGDETFKPSVSDLRDSFLVGGVIGAGMSGIETYRDRRAKTKIGETLKSEVQEEEAATEEEVAAGVVQSIQQGQFQDAEAKAFPVVRNYDADSLPMDVSNTRFANAPALRFQPNRDARARPFLPELAAEELLPPSTIGETELEAYELLDTPGKRYALEIAAHEELTAFGRPGSVINNYGDKIRRDFLENRVVEPQPDVQPLNETELKALDPEALPVSQLPENTVQADDQGNALIENEAGLQSFVTEMDSRYGENNWALRQFGNQEIATSEQFQSRVNASLQEGKPVKLNGFVQSFNPNTAGQPSFRVHAIKRNGKMEVVPYATTNNALSLPFVFESDQKSNLEAAALASVNENLETLGEGKIVGVDVTLGKDGTPTVTETQAVDSSLDPTSPNPQPPSGNEYVNAAIYAALKGRVPAFAIQARQTLREQAANARLDDDMAYDIGVNLSQLAKNKEDFGNQVQGFYGDRYAPVVDSLWQAARDKDLSRVREVVAGVNQETRDETSTPQVLESNQKILSEVQAELNDAATAASQATRQRKDRTQQPAEELNEVFHIPPSVDGEPMTVEAVQAVVDDLTGGSVNIRVINNYDAPFAGRILNRRDIQLNAARIISPEHAREVLLEEAIHAVWNDSGIQDAWAGIKALATRDEVLEIQQHYASHGVNISYSTALEEWSNREVRRKYLQEQGPVKTFVDRVWAKLKEIFGLAAPENASDAARIMHRALEYLSEETIKNSRLKPAAPANAHVFANGQVAGPSNFYITAVHATRAPFSPTEANPLGQFNNRFIGTGEGNQVYGQGMYFAESTKARDFYLRTLSDPTSLVNTSISLQVRINADPDVLLDWDNEITTNEEIFAKIEREFPAFVASMDDFYDTGETFYAWLSNTLGTERQASETLERMGIKGIQYNDAGSRVGITKGTKNYVIFNPATVEIMENEQTGQSFSLQSPGLRLTSDQALYSIPEDQKKDRKRERQRERLSRLKRLKVEDRYDSNTKTLTQLLRKIKPKQVEAMAPQHVEDFYDLVDHLYQARTNKISKPDIREDSGVLIDELRQYRRLLDMSFIQGRIKEMGDIMDYSGYKGRMDDRESFEAYENQLAKENKLDLSKAKPENREAWERKQANWRAKFNEAKAEFIATLPTADAWIEDIEALNGKKFKSEKQKEVMRLHHRYMTEVVEPESLEGRALYDHFHELNNMLDGQSIYLPETSIAWIAGVRDSGINIYDLKGKFRDPVILRNEFLKGVDLAQRFTELKQTQLGRFSAFTEAKDWLQNDLMGPLLDSILRESSNHQADSNARYIAAKKQFEKNVKRKMNSEDTITMSMVSRLIQFPVEQDPNVAFRDNLANEQKAIDNMIQSGSKALESEARTVYQPILNRLTQGLVESSVPMEDFMASMDDRFGLGESQVGKQRSLLLSQMQELMDEYSLDSQFISEAFYKKPFKAYANYLPRRALSIAPEKLNARNHDIAQEISEFDDNWYKTNGITAETEQLKTRSRIGDNAYYSNNIEYIFDRGIRISSLTASTTAERFILKQRLRKGGEVHGLIQGSDKTYRVNQLQEWASSLFLNAMHSGSPLGTIGQWMRRFNELYARVALSGLHQGVTQTMSGFTDYHIRTGNISGAMQAAQYLINKRADMDAWFERHAARISNRSLLGEQELDRRRSPSLDENAIRNHPMVKKLEGYYEGASKIITFSLRQGDDFSAKSLVMAEYARLLKQKGHKFHSYADMDWNVVDGPALTQAMLSVEQNINSSDKITRGELFTDRTWGLSLFRNVLLAFSSHTMVLAAQFNQATRDLIDLKAQGASKEKMAQQVRTIGAILGQSFVFSSGRFALNAGMATVMIGLLRDLFDDEEGKLAELQENLDYARKTGDDVRVQAAEAELSQAKAIRDSIVNFENRNTSFTAYYQGVLKESLGSVHFAFGGPGIPQKFIFPVADVFGEKMYKEAMNTEVEKMKKRIEIERKAGNYGKAARLTEDLITMEAVEYLPLNIEQFGNIGMGGITGTALSATYASWKEVNNAAQGLTEYNLNDVILAAQSAGLGQADINRYLKTVDKIEDELYRKGKESEEQRKKAQARQQGQDERAQERQLRALLRTMD